MLFFFGRIVTALQFLISILFLFEDDVAVVTSSTTTTATTTSYAGSSSYNSNFIRGINNNNSSSRLLRTTTTRTTSEEKNQLDDRPMFLFSGQSNMEGHTLGEYSIEYDSVTKKGRDMFHDILEILLNHHHDNSDDDSLLLLQQCLENRIQFASANPQEASQNEAKELIRLYKQGYFLHINQTHPTATCSYQNQYPQDGVFPEVPLSPYSKCGAAFGPELMFAHVLSRHWDNHRHHNNKEEDDTATSTTAGTFNIAKVAVGGTQIYKDWFPGVGKYWDKLNYTIHHTQGHWEGFVWYQGENDVFPVQEPEINAKIGEDTSPTYLGNLTAFINAVRTEIVRSNTKGGTDVRSNNYNHPRDVPVAIFQIGPWPGKRDGEDDYSKRSKRIRDAQAEFVKNDNLNDNRTKKSILIQDMDLSQFYHFDAPSQLIMGSRLAEQWIHTFFKTVSTTKNEEEEANLD